MKFKVKGNTYSIRVTLIEDVLRPARTYVQIKNETNEVVTNFQVSCLPGTCGMLIAHDFWISEGLDDVVHEALRRLRKCHSQWEAKGKVVVTDRTSGRVYAMCKARSNVWTAGKEVVNPNSGNTICLFEMDLPWDLRSKKQ